MICRALSLSEGLRAPHILVIWRAKLHCRLHYILHYSILPYHILVIQRAKLHYIFGNFLAGCIMFCIILLLSSHIGHSIFNIFGNFLAGCIFFRVPSKYRWGCLHILVILRAKLHWQSNGSPHRVE